MQLEFKQEVQHQLVLQLETSTTSVLGQQTPLLSTHTRQQGIDSVNGLILNTIDLDVAYGANVGIVTFKNRNAVYSKSVNTSSSDVTNFSLLSSSSLDAQNIISGVFDPARLGSGTANADVVLYGDSSFKKVIKSVGIGTTQPIGVTYTSADLAPGGVGINTYYGDIQMTLNRVVSTPDDYSTLGISKFKLSTFAIGDDGAITIRSSTNSGDIDGDLGWTEWCILLRY